MSDVETPPAANGAATDADVEITSPPPSDDPTVVPKLISKIHLLEQDLVNDKLKIQQLEDEISSHESDKRALSSIAARASELETEVSRLQHDLISSVSDAQEANAEVSDMKRKVVELEAKETENEEKLSVMENERNLLLEKVKESEEKFNESESENARKIEVLVSKINEFEAKERENEAKSTLLVEKLKESEREKDKLKEKLKESEKKISELESEGKNKNVKVNEMLEKLDLLQKEIVSKEDVVESTINWPVVAVSAGAVVTLALVYFRHAKF